jgi:hypothetical protein
MVKLCKVCTHKFEDNQRSLGELVTGNVGQS